MPSPDAARAGRRRRVPTEPACGVGCVAAGASPLPNAIVAKTGSAGAAGVVPRRDDVDRPLAVGGRRRVAEVRVARLVAQMKRDDELARRRGRRERELHADRERLLEHGERLVLAGLLEIGRRRKHDFLHRDAGRRVDRQLGRNQQRIARLVRLGVQPFGERHLERDARGVAARAALACSTSARDVGLRAGAIWALRRRLRCQHRGHRGHRGRNLDDGSYRRVLGVLRVESVHPTPASAESRLAAAAARVGSTVPLTGGRSWYMKSHFHRSDGFDACSQFRASSGRLNASVVSPWSSATVGEARRRCRRGRRRRVVYANGTPSAAPRSTRICQSSCASPGSGIARDGALQAALLIRIGRFLLDVGCARQHEIGGARQVGHQHALDDQQAERAALARVDDPLRVAERAFGPGIEHVERGHASAVDRLAQRRRRPARATVVAGVAGREAEHPRAVDVRRVDRRHLELRRRRAAASRDTASVTLIAFGPRRRAAPAVRRLKRNSSSCDACAESRKRTPSRGSPRRPRPADRAASRSRRATTTGCCALAASAPAA